MQCHFVSLKTECLVSINTGAAWEVCSSQCNADCAGKWTVQQAAEMSVAAPTIEASLDGRFVSGLKEERVKAAKFYDKLGVKAPSQLVSLLSPCLMMMKLVRRCQLVTCTAVLSVLPSGTPRVYDLPRHM